MHFDPDPETLLGFLSLAIDTRYNFVTNFLQLCLSVYLWSPFSQLWFGLIGCMILMKQYVYLRTIAMKMGKRHFYSDHSNGC